MESMMVLAVSAGVFMALQAPTNAALGGRVGLLQATSMSFLGGVVLLALAVAFVGSGDLTLIAHAQPWQLLGGVYGMVCVFSLAYATPALGAALALTAYMLGQLVGGLVIDSCGFFFVEAAPFSPARAAGCALVAAGVVLVGVARMGGGEGGSILRGVRQAAGALALAFVGGVASAMQAPTNASLGTLIGPIETSLVSFSVGLALILTITLVKSRGKIVPLRGVAPWQCLGGAYGALVTTFMVISTPALGVSLLLAAMMFGQLVCAMVLDGAGLLGLVRTRMSAKRVAGVLLVACGIALVLAAKMA